MPAPLTNLATGEVIPDDDAERTLRALYEQAPGTVRLGMIRAADGAAAGSDGSARSINGPEDLRALRTLRSWADVVLVGASTALTDRYRDIGLTAALARARAEAGVNPDPLPQLAVVTRHGRLPEGLSPGRTWLITTAAHAAVASYDSVWGPRVLVVGDDTVDLARAVAELGARGAARILCEGGPTLASGLLDAGLVDDYCLTTSAKPGSPAAPRVPPVPEQFTLRHALTGGDFTLERWMR